MFSNIALDIFIGFVFIFLLYSLLATILQELIARWFNLRSRMLLRAIRRMLEDRVFNRSKAWQRSTFISYFFEFKENIRRYLNPMRENEHMIQRFYDHPSIKYLGEDKANSKPSYLQPHNFSHTLVQLLRGNTYDGSTQNEADLIKNALDNNLLNINNETHAHLQHLFADARQDVHLFRQRLEQWFDETMQRTNGWYKKQSQLILIFVGIFVAWTFNVDAIAIYDILNTNKDAREQLVQMAVESHNQYEARIALLRSSPTSDSDQTSALQKQSDAILKETYQAVANDAQRTNDILGLGKPWKDSCKICEDSLNNNKNRQQEQLTSGKKEMIDSLKGVITSFNDSIRKYEAIARRRQAGIQILDSFKKLKVRLEQNILQKQQESNKAQLQKQQFEERCAFIKAQMDATPFKYSANQKGGITTVLGWLLTALAISLGAPFWFDLLSRFVQLRTAGQRVPAGKPVSGIAGTSSVNSVVTPDNKTIRG